MTTTYVSEGKVIQHTATAVRTAGVPFAINGVMVMPLVDLGIGETGSVATEGVFSCPKVSGAVIGQMETLTWDVSANSSAGAFDDNLATPATGDVTGDTALAFEAAGDGDTTVLVKLTGNKGTVA